MRPQFSAALCVGLAIGATAATAAHATPATLTQTAAVSQTEGKITLVFQGVTLAAAAVSSDALEIALSLNEPLQEKLARELPSLAVPIFDVSTGYDSLLIRAQSPSTFETESVEGGFALTIKSSTGDSNAKGLGLVEIRRLTLTGDTEAARTLLSQLRPAFDTDRELLRLDADIDAADQDYRSAARKYAQLLSLDPNDASAISSLNQAQNQLAPFVEAGINTSKIEKADRQVRSFIAGRVPLSEFVGLRARADFVELDDNAVLFPDGISRAFSGSRSSSQVDTLFDLGGRWHATLSLFAGDGTIGSGAGIAYRDASSSVQLEAAYNRPSWDYPETIASNATTDSATFIAAKSFENKVFLNLGLTAKRFNIAGEEEAASLLAAEASLRYKLPIGGKTDISLGYTFDGEFVEHLTLKPDGGGGFYSLIPVSDRIVHTLDLRASAPLGKELFASALIGYSRDDASQDGLVAGSELTFTPVHDLKLSLNAYYGGLSSRSGESGSYFYGGFTATKLFATSSEDAQ